MGLQMLVLWMEAFLSASLIYAAPVSETFVVSVTSEVTVHTKHTVTLPCWLSPPQSAEDMEVAWYYKDQFEAPVVLYKDKTFKTVDKERVSFGQRDESSGGLKDGDVTLKLLNVTLADAGKYTCYVSSDQHHDRADLHLFVNQTGVTPLLTAVVREDTINVSCQSEGWYPEPQLHWSDGSSALIPKVLDYNKDSFGLVSVHSWLLVSISSVVSCSVGLSGEEAVMGRMRVEAPSPQAQEVSGSSVAGWVLFGIVAVFALALLGFLFRGKYLKSKTCDAVDAGECQKLLPKDFSALLSEANNVYANIQLENADDGVIKVRNNKLRDGDKCPDGDKVTCITAVSGTPGFSSGKHYWEVSLMIMKNEDGKSIPDIKRSWWIGVTSQSVIPKDQNFSPTVDNGFWFLSSEFCDKVESLQFSTKPATFLGLSAPPQKIGVYLDYDGGLLSFYNLDNRSLIGAFPGKFTGKVFPLFNPGKGDQGPMEIIQKKTDDESSDMVNTTA